MFQDGMQKKARSYRHGPREKRFEAELRDTRAVRSSQIIMPAK